MYSTVQYCAFMYTCTVLEDQWDYDHSPRWKKSLDGDRPPPVILTVIVQSIVMTWCVSDYYVIISRRIWSRSAVWHIVRNFSLLS